MTLIDENQAEQACLGWFEGPACTRAGMSPGTKRANPRAAVISPCGKYKGSTSRFAIPKPASS